MKKNLFRIVGIVLFCLFSLIILLSLVGTVAEATGLVDDTVEAGIVLGIGYLGIGGMA